MESCKTVCFKLDPTLLLRVDAYATTHNMQRSEVIRLALERFLEQEETLPPAKIEKPFKIRR